MLDAGPTWTIARDLVTDTVTVSTGLRTLLLTPGRDGKFNMDHLARASVSANRPDAARVEAETTVQLHTPTGSVVDIAARSWATQTGVALWGQVIVDGQPYFERRWQN
jgi:hypothetical protein